MTAHPSPDELFPKRPPGEAQRSGAQSGAKQPDQPRSATSDCTTSAPITSSSNARFPFGLTPGDPLQSLKNQDLEAALSVRKDQKFEDARYQIMEIREAVQKDDIKTANAKAEKISVELDKLLQVIRKKYGLPSAPTGVPVNPIVKTFNTIASLKSLPELPEIDVKIPLPEFIQKALTQRGIVQTYRNILNDLPTIWKLGDVHEKLTRAIRKSDEPAFTPKTESPEFRYAHSQWKSPM